MECFICKGDGGWWNSYVRDLDEYFDWNDCVACDGTGEEDTEGGC